MTEDHDAPLAFCAFPVGHQDHLRMSNPIESMFAMVRHRITRTEGTLLQDIAQLMAFKLVMTAVEIRRRLKSGDQLPKVVQGVTFRNGVEVADAPAQGFA